MTSVCVLGNKIHESKVKYADASHDFVSIGLNRLTCFYWRYTRQTCWSEEIHLQTV